MRVLWEYVDEALTSTTARAIGSHLETCERCNPHLTGARAFLRAVGACDRWSRAPASLRVRVFRMRSTREMDR
jgi:hypothetical protein